MTGPTKKCWMLLLVCGIVAVYLLLIVTWALERTPRPFGLGALMVLNTSIWLVVVCWALHHLAFQLAPLMHRRTPEVPKEVAVSPRFVILYTTCDDFLAECCATCFDQDYPQDAYRVVVCDDSRDPACCSEVALFCKGQPRSSHVTRTGRRGFKAGNLNNAIAQATSRNDKWIVIVDADQVLPRGFLSGLAPRVAELAPEVVFVQAAHDPRHLATALGDLSLRGGCATEFQMALGYESLLFYEADMAYRETFGFLPFLGHGGAVRRIAWETLGGFPEVVSEDYAFTMEARNAGFHGAWAPDLRSWEGFPADFSAFVVRFTKFASGAAELIRRHLGRFVWGNATLVEKVDLQMLLLSYALLPLMLVNFPLSAYLCHVLWNEYAAMIHPWLAHGLMLMFLLSIPVIVSVVPDLRHALRYWFWALAVYGAMLPIAAFRFMRDLFRPAAFERTPKRDVGRGRIARYMYGTSLLGLVFVALAWIWMSPFSGILCAYGIAAASCPFYTWLHEKSLRGRFARGIIYLPGVSLSYSVIRMWLWATI